MRCYEIKDERNRTCGYKYTTEIVTDPIILKRLIKFGVDVDHTMSSAYFQAAMVEDKVSIDCMMRGVSDLEYEVMKEPLSDLEK